MKVVNDLLLSCDKKIPIVVMFLDLSAAFDTIDQCMLLQILRNEIGVCDLALKWFESFLIGRTQTVKINDAYSDETGLDFGFAQGSILGPKLFNIYTRSSPGTIHSIGHSVEGYADDQQIWKEFSTMFQVSALGKNIDMCFSVISSWMNKYFLKLNSDKTKIMVVAPQSVQKDVTIHGSFINDKCIRFVSTAKNLGVLLDSELCFNVQVTKVVSSCFHILKLLTRIKSFLTKNQLKTLACTLIFPKLDYCNGLYYGLDKSIIKKLQSVQNNAARLVNKINRFDRVPVNKLLSELHWLKVNERIVFKILLTMHKCVIGNAPEELASKILSSCSNRTMKIDCQYCYSSFGCRAFSVCGPKLWNALPLHMRYEGVTSII